MMKNIFIVGSKGIPGKYGGYESFVDYLTKSHQDEQNIKYHVACKSIEKGEFKYNNARCFNIKVPNIGSSQAIYYDVMALRDCCVYIRRNKIENPIIYILACRIGPFIAYFRRRIHQLGGEVYINPDGHEWKRAKWSLLVRKYWKISEKTMVKHADLIICDSKKIEEYIIKTYKQYSPKTTFISYGAEIKQSSIEEKNEMLLSWYKENDVSSHDYYLIVGRLVPENNYETMIREFMKSKTKKSLILITDIANNYYERLRKITKWDEDKRIKFVGTIYDRELLKKIRENAFAYVHGHEVGGTNPSLLEALGSTKINLLLDVEFNREVGAEAALYWTKENESLVNLMKYAEGIDNEQMESLGMSAKKRIENNYSWQSIANKYKELFFEGIVENEKG